MKTPRTREKEINGLHPTLCVVPAAFARELEIENQKMRVALELISAYDSSSKCELGLCGGLDSGCDSPAIAQEVLKSLAGNK